MLIQESFDLELAQEVSGEVEQPIVQAASSALDTSPQGGGCF